MVSIFHLRTLLHQLLQPQVLPSGLPFRLSGALDPKRSVLVGYDVVFVLGVDGLVVRRDVDLLGLEGRAGEFLCFRKSRG